GLGSNDRVQMATRRIGPQISGRHQQCASEGIRFAFGFPARQGAVSVENEMTEFVGNGEPAPLCGTPSAQEDERQVTVPRRERVDVVWIEARLQPGVEAVYADALPLGKVDHVPDRLQSQSPL